MKSKMMFETDDGKVFDTSFAAVQHERRLALEHWYENGNELIADYAQVPRVHFDDLVEWLKRNNIIVRKLLDL